jgi:Xaa-Pro aminopeptidase
MHDPDFAERLKSLRNELAKAGLDGFLVPMADEYQSEYVPPSARRIEFLSGFTGSAGFIAVLKDKAGFFTDGRYTLQASQQLPVGLFTLYDSADKAPSDWLGENIGKGAKIGYDPWLHTADQITRFKKAADKAGAVLTPVDRNPLDIIWRDRPAPPAGPIYPHDIVYAGKSADIKRAEIASELKRKSLGAAVLTDTTSIAWLLNVRGSDVPNAPLPLSFAIIRDDGRVKWFVDPRKLTDGLVKHLGPDVAIEKPEKFAAMLDALAKTGSAIRIDPAETASWIIERVKAANGKLDLGDDPCALSKACKNATELTGMRESHKRDGAALVKFFAWLDNNLASNEITEISASEKLAEFRGSNNLYRSPSFDTISGAGSHGAIVHYKATPVTNRRLEAGQLYLLDSGGQYLDGTTDVTRTISLGAPTPEMRDRFTRVLKGHIALAAVRFPEGTAGAELDALARQYLWGAGCDYSHGTGHGVGYYLNVHEGPQGISKRSHVALKPGMIVSNEPGYYKAGAYGIRIENLQVVTEAAEIPGGDKKMLGFETLTMAPIDRRLIETSLLTQPECDWLNAYHARVRKALTPMVDKAAAEWLEAATAGV